MEVRFFPPVFLFRFSILRGRRKTVGEKKKKKTHPLAPPPPPPPFSPLLQTKHRPSSKKNIAPPPKNLCSRVIERSHVLVQVVDARDPLRYLSADLALAAAEAAGPDPAPPLLVLLNKADLLPPEAREAWAAELEARGLRFAWWSAKAAGDAAAEQASAVVAALSAGLPPPDFPRPRPSGESDRTRILGAEELLEWLEREARAAAKGATGRRAVAASFLGESDSEGEEEDQEAEGSDGGGDGETEEQRHRRETSNRRPTAGFVGFPNVGKSSTLNALFGRKKAAVAPTPGKTKHFQTLDLFVSGGGGGGDGGDGGLCCGCCRLCCCRCRLCCCRCRLCCGCCRLCCGRCRLCCGRCRLCSSSCCGCCRLCSSCCCRCRLCSSCPRRLLLAHVPGPPRVLAFRQQLGDGVDVVRCRRDGQRTLFLVRV